MIYYVIKRADGSPLHDDPPEPLENCGSADPLIPPWTPVLIAIKNLHGVLSRQVDTDRSQCDFDENTKCWFCTVVLHPEKAAC